MKVVEKYLTDFKNSFKGCTYLSSYSCGRATGEFIKLFIAPYCFIMTLGFITLATGDKWDGILLNAINEFIQMSGIKLSFYFVVGLIAFSLIFYGFSRVTKILSWLIRFLSHAGFSMIAILTGVLWGAVIPGCIDLNNLSPFYDTLEVSLVAIIPVTLIFYASNKLFCTKTRKIIDDQLGEHVTWFTVVIGIILMGMFIEMTFFNETWNEIRLVQ